MNKLICVLTILFVLLFIYNFFIKVFAIEPLENSSDNTTTSCETSKILVYKNAGMISALQDKINQLMTQVNTLILGTDKNTTNIQHLQTIETKYNKLAKQADVLANDNKQRLLAMAKQAHSTATNAKAQSNKISFSKK